MDNKSLEAVREVDRAAKVSVAAGDPESWQAKQIEEERQKQDTEIIQRLDNALGAEVKQTDALEAELADAEQHISLLQDMNRALHAAHWAADRVEEGPEVEHKTTNCLRRAAALVCGERAADYGPPSASFRAVALAWQAYFDAAPNEDVNARDVANMMIIYKCLRDAHRPKQDNMDDIAGYAQVAAWIGTDA